MAAVHTVDESSVPSALTNWRSNHATEARTPADRLPHNDCGALWEQAANVAAPDQHVVAGAIGRGAGGGQAIHGRRQVGVFLRGPVIGQRVGRGRGGRAVGREGQAGLARIGAHAVGQVAELDRGRRPRPRVHLVFGGIGLQAGDPEHAERQDQHHDQHFDQRKSGKVRRPTRSGFGRRATRIEGFFEEYFEVCSHAQQVPPKAINRVRPRALRQIDRFEARVSDRY